MHKVTITLFTLLITTALCVDIFPASLSSSSGSVSSQPLSVLQTRDQSGSADDWNKYIEFDGKTTKYTGSFTFDVSSVTGSVSSYALVVNYNGPRKSDQVWQFEYLLPSSNTYSVAGDNTAAKDWTWTLLTLTGSVSFPSLVSAGKITVRFSSTTAYDKCDLDYLSLSITTGSSTSAPVTPPPTTRPATLAPTSKPATLAPTSKPPTLAPTSKPATTAPVTSTTGASATSGSTTGSNMGNNGRLCPLNQRWQPRPQMTWQWQIDGTVSSTNQPVQAYDIDMNDASDALIQTLHNNGKAVICYIDTAYEPNRDDASQFPQSVIGKEIGNWGEYWVDIRSSVVRNIMAARIHKAFTRGCDALEMDDVDAYLNNPGFDLSYDDQLSFNRFLAVQAHQYNMGIALKNDVDQIVDLVNYFDFAINEECFAFNECDNYTYFINENKAVLGTEYDSDKHAKPFATFCPVANQMKLSWLDKTNTDLDDSELRQCCTNNGGVCPSPTALADRKWECITP